MVLNGWNCFLLGVLFVFLYNFDTLAAWFSAILQPAEWLLKLRGEAGSTQVLHQLILWWYQMEAAEKQGSFYIADKNDLRILIQGLVNVLKGRNS